MKERPILFSTPMVRAILDGKKTQTRRVVKPQPIQIGWFDHQKGFCAHVSTDDAGTTYHEMVKCPYGQPGDRLWVRETWAPTFHGEDCIYAADPYVGPFPFTGKWRPSIHMPRWASRLTLEIVSVRVERLLKITLSDIWDEGRGMPPDIDDSIEARQREWVDGPAWYRNLWDSINGKKHPWESNPWVWVVEFREANERANGRES